MTPTCITIKNPSVLEYLMLKFCLVSGLKTWLRSLLYSVFSICPQGEYEAVSSDWDCLPGHSLKLSLVTLILLPRPAQRATIKHNIIGSSSWDQYLWISHLWIFS